MSLRAGEIMAGMREPDVTAGVAGEIVGEGSYWVVRQGVEEVRDPENSPAVGMGKYLVETGQEDLFREISVYVERGDSREEVRRLYMNAVALRVWRDMGREAQVVGRQRRPGRGSELGFGVPYSE